MASINKKSQVHTEVTHEGGPAKRLTPEQQLRRSVLACLLWEDQFYEDGESIAKRIEDLIPKVDAAKVAALAIEARNKMNLRHMPLFIARQMAKVKSSFLADTLAEIIQRPDELTEYLAIYNKDKRQPLSAQSKKGLARAFQKFNEYQLAKYNRPGSYKLRDILFLVHPKPTDDTQSQMWKRVIENKLTPPDTWEVALIRGKDKRETFERLLNEGKLGYLALLRNLRNMIDSGMDKDFIGQHIISGVKSKKAKRVLPFRFISAAKAAPVLESYLDDAMQISVNQFEKLPGKTIILVDVSGSMGNPISAKSNLNRMDGASALAVLGQAICESCEVLAFSETLTVCPPRKGMALVDFLKHLSHGGTNLGDAVTTINKTKDYHRIIVLTDEQSSDPVPNPKGKGYMINVASYQNGVGYGKWMNITGFSETVFDYILTTEKESLS